MKRFGILTLGVIAVLCLHSGSAAAQKVPRCRGTGPRATLELERVNGQNVTAAGTAVTMPFDDSRTPSRFTFEYKVVGCRFERAKVGKALKKLEYFPPRDARGRNLDADVPLGSEFKTGELIVISLEVDPSGDASPGSYHTGFAVSHRRFELLRQDVTATLQYAPRAWLVLAILGPAAVGGSVLVWLKGRAGGSTERFRTWVWKVANAAAIVAGLAAALVYLDTVVFTDEDFGRQLHESHLWEWAWQSDWYKSVGAAGSAFVTAVLGFTLIGDSARGGTDSAATSAAPQPGRFAPRTD